MKQLEQFNLLKQQQVIGVSPVRVQDGICDQEQVALNTSLRYVHECSNWVCIAECSDGLHGKHPKQNRPLRESRRSKEQETD
jgi:hypothetical protein